jgi:hypothetical protein
VGDAALLRFAVRSHGGETPPLILPRFCIEAEYCLTATGHSA